MVSQTLKATLLFCFLLGADLVAPVRAQFQVLGTDCPAKWAGWTSPTWQVYAPQHDTAEVEFPSYSGAAKQNPFYTCNQAQVTGTLATDNVQCVVEIRNSQL